MVRAADGMTIVESEANVGMRSPPELPSRPWIAFECVERGVVPDQDVAAQLRPPLGDERKQCVESGWRLFVSGGGREQVHTGEDVPAKNEDRPARGEQCVSDE